MKLVYMVIECSGEYEDYRERCIAAYFQEEKARAKREELEGIAEQRRQQLTNCDDCYNRYLYHFDSENEFKQFLEGPLPTHCDYIKDVKWHEDFEFVTCDNACHSWRDDNVTYRIDVLEVEE